MLPQAQNSREADKADRHKQLHKFQARKQLHNKELITASNGSISLFKEQFQQGIGIKSTTAKNMDFLML